jgi:hydrogenase/urease accessory protein HupE
MVTGNSLAARARVSLRLLPLGLAWLVMLLPRPVSAHVEGGPLGGFESGFTHPIFGMDHLLAMLAVGI